MGSRCPPLRSALLITASNRAIRRSLASSVTARADPLGHRRARPRSPGSSRDGPSPATRSSSGWAVLGLDPLLAHAGAEGPVAQHRARHQVPAGRDADQVGGHLARGEGAVREVPQRAFPGDGLVDAVRRPAVRGRPRTPASRRSRGRSDRPASVRRPRAVRGPRDPTGSIDTAVRALLRTRRTNRIPRSAGIRWCECRRGRPR